MADLRVELSGVEMKNPVIPASGTYGYGMEYTDFYDINILGAFSFKGTTREARCGNDQPRIAECEGGLLNSIGLQNPGIEAVISAELPELAKVYSGPLIANISGFSVDDFVYCCERIDSQDQVDIIEVNISCPNVHGGGMAFGTDPKSAALVTSEVKKVTKKPVYIKLTPNVTDIASIARACEEAGADGIALINTMLGMRIDIRRRQPVLKNRKGGFSGRAIFPVAVRMVNDVYEAVEIPIIGMGGVSSASDVIEMMMAGATAVEIGAENLRDPMVCKKIIDDLPGLCGSLGIDRLKDIIGCVR